MPDWVLKMLLPLANKWASEAVQAGALSVAVYLEEHGYATHDDTSKIVGSLFFLAMLAWSAIEKAFLTKKDQTNP